MNTIVIREAGGLRLGTREVLIECMDDLQGAAHLVLDFIRRPPF